MGQTLNQRLSTLSEPIRVRVLRLVQREELGVGELARITQAPQSTVSRHLKVLLSGEWVTRRSVGTANLFRLQEESLSEERRALWAVVRRQFEAEQENACAEDLRRMTSVLALRRVDSREFFERHATRWDDLRRDLFGDAFWVPTLAAMLPADAVVADLGCGTGELLVRLAPAVGQVIGVDREAAMLSVAGQRASHLPNAEVREGGLEDLPIESDSIDAVFCMLVLHHVSDPGPAFSEAARVLRPGGHLVILDMLAHEREELRTTMGHVHLGFSRETLAGLAAASGLELDRHIEIGPDADALGPPLAVSRFRFPE